MVTDVQLAIFANMLGVSLFLLVVLYHYVAVNNPKKQEWRLQVCSLHVSATSVCLLFSVLVVDTMSCCPLCKIKPIFSVQFSSMLICKWIEFRSATNDFFSFLCSLIVNILNVSFFSQERWDSHQPGNNIPLFQPTFQKMNLFLWMHSSDFFFL